ncbi:unnamed protein product [Bursaphelenchus xylophilus]|uniref:(pine wood nematode) hypothetical protein n=1 Tax=Bursaphelenchus xylophilus TaxID=6326 RepID=A0A1I7RZU0_BURXY|nr:unnamed protein product [Bursaphelenchus xylophilus]CAG9109237.1 unnamed protein product [Bursaphelenchus xylophilus]
MGEAWDRFFRSRAAQKAAYHGRAGAKQVRSFPEWTSMLALPQVVYFRRFCSFFWFLLFLAALGIAAWQLIETIKNYRSYGFTTTRTLNFDAHPFPAVTACDLNPFKRDLAYQNAEIVTLMNALEYAFEKTRCSTNNCTVDTNSTLDSYISEYGLSDLRDTSTVVLQASRLLTLITGSLNLTSASAQYDDFIQGCSFNTQDCVDTDWTKFESQAMGTCFTFNIAKARNVSRVGPIYGLRAIIKTNVSQYLPVSPSAGFKVLVHHQDEYPFPDIYGVNVMVGSAAMVGVSYTEVTRLGQPYSKCVLDSPEDYIYPKNYSTEGCLRSAYQLSVIKNCGCYDPSFPASSNLTVQTNDGTNVSMKRIGACTLDNYACWISQSDSNFVNNCTNPCYETSYSVGVSFASWPSGSSSTIGACMGGDYGNLTCDVMYAQNGALIQVFFEAQSYEVMAEVPTYPTSSFLSDFGGTLSLWIGGSILVLLEIALLFIQCVFTCICPCCDRHIGY